MEPLVASLLLAVRPGAPSSFLLLVVRMLLVSSDACFAFASPFLSREKQQTSGKTPTSLLRQCAPAQLCEGASNTASRRGGALAASHGHAAAGTRRDLVAGQPERLH